MNKLVFRYLVVILLGLVATHISAQDLWDGTTASSFYGGSGTESDPYQIRTGAELVYFANLVNSGDDFSGKYVKLMNDIDMNKQSFSVTGLFAGTFDGGGRFVKMMLGIPTNNNPFKQVSGRIHHLGVKIDLENEYNSVYYGDIQIIKNLLEGGILEDCYYSIQTSVQIFSYQEALVYNNSGIIRNCCTVGHFSTYGNYTNTKGSLLVYNNNATGIIENNYPYVNNGTTYFGIQLPIAFNNYGTIVHNTTNIDSLNMWVDEHPGHSRWTSTGIYKLVDFNPSSECTIEFVDTLFNNSIPPIVRAYGEPIGQLPVPIADCTFAGWNRMGKLVNPTDIVNDNWMLFAKWQQSIRMQPTYENMLVEVDDVEHASFQWYAVYGEATQLPDWVSPQIDDGTSTSNTIEFQAYEDQVLSFNYKVSSEPGYDVFTLSCNGTIILKASGEKEDVFSYTIPSDGNYKFVFKYSKDDDSSMGSDNVIITNTTLSNAKNRLDCTSSQLPEFLITQNGLYFCTISYSNTGVVLTSDTVKIDERYLDNILEIVGTTGFRGMLLTVPINLVNHESITSFEFLLTLPEGVTLVDKSLGERSENHKRTSEQFNSETWHFIVQSPNSLVFDGNEGNVLYLILGIDDNLQYGDYSITLSDIALTTVDGTILRPKDAIARLSLNPAGDVDGNGEISIADVTELIDYLLSK